MTTSQLKAPLSRRGLLHHLTGQSVAYGFAGALGKALALITVPLLTRSLSAEAYGLADLATSLAAIGTIVTMFSGDIPAALLRAQAPIGERRRVLAAYLLAVAVVSTGTAVLLIPLGEGIARVIWLSPGSGQLAALAVALIPISAVQGALITVLRLEGRAVAFALLSVVDLVAQLSLAVILVLAGFGPTGILLGFIAGSVVGLLAALPIALPNVSRSLDLKLAARVFRLGIPFLPATLAFVFADYGARFLLVDFLGVRTVGQFAVAIRLASLVTLISAAFSMAWGPYGLSQRAGTRTARLFGVVLRWYVLIAAYFAIVLGALAPEVVVVVSGVGYREAAEALPGLVLGAAMGGATYVLIVAAGVSERSGAVAGASVAGAVGQLAAIALLLPTLGLMAVGVGVVTGRSLSFALLARALPTLDIVIDRDVMEILLVSVGLVLWLQILNQHPAASLGLRVAIVITATLLVLVSIRKARARPPDA